MELHRGSKYHSVYLQGPSIITVGDTWSEDMSHVLLVVFMLEVLETAIHEGTGGSVECQTWLV